MILRIVRPSPADLPSQGGWPQGPPAEAIRGTLPRGKVPQAGCWKGRNSDLMLCSSENGGSVCASGGKLRCLRRLQRSFEGVQGCPEEHNTKSGRAHHSSRFRNGTPPFAQRTPPNPSLPGIGGVGSSKQASKQAREHARTHARKQASKQPTN